MPETNPTNPTAGDMYNSSHLNDEEEEDIKDFITYRFGFGTEYNDIAAEQRREVRQFLRGFESLINGSTTLTKNLERVGTSAIVDAEQRVAIDRLKGNAIFTDELIKEYTRLSYSTSNDDQAVELRGYKIYHLIDLYKAQEGKEALEAPISEQEDYIRKQLNTIGSGFTPLFDHIDTQGQLADYVLNRPGKFRQDTAPTPLARWECRVGASKFLVPPTSINVSQSFQTGSLTGGAIRQSTSPKTNLGHSDTTITMQLIFPTHESIWGFKGDRADLDIFNWDPSPVMRDDIPGVLGQAQVPSADVPDDVIDYYLSSMRGLITQFKYSPILPIRNEYINRVFDITAVTLNNMTVSTVDGFPFVMAVTLEMSKFNYAAFLPMVQDFDQAVHWGKFRQYLGRAAAALDAKVNEGFLVDKGDPLTHYTPTELMELQDKGVSLHDLQYVSAPNIPRFDKLQDLADGKHLNFYYPITTPSRIYAPDTTDFRQPGEDLVVTKDIWDGFLGNIGLDLIEAPRFDFFEYSNSTRRTASETNLLNSWLRINSVMWTQMDQGNKRKFVDESIADEKKNGAIKDTNQEAIRRLQLNDQWYFTLFGAFLESDSEIKKAREKINDANNYTIKEWAVPMEKLAIDWTQCIIQGISVNMSNNFSRMQVQLLESPTYQFIGGGDSTMSVSMIVMGEENLIRLRRAFEHINGLARLEQAHGVLGFLGIKNVITALCGMKYVLPNTFEVSTVPNMPHVTHVTMTFVDFDIEQQKREELSSEAQQRLVDTFSKRNPFLRMKQAWHWFNGYPDMPLGIKNENGTTVGYLDPDWYFRSFKTKDEDLTHWGLDDSTANVLTRFAEVTRSLDAFNGRSITPEEDLLRMSLTTELAQLERELADVASRTDGKILPGYVVENGRIRIDGSLVDPEKDAEMRTYLGVYGENNEMASFIDFFKGGYFMLGTENTKTNESKYVLGLAQFKEDLASANTKDVGSIPNTVGLSKYQNEYINGSTSPQRQFESMMQDFDYRSISGRMIRAFPTYMLWVIDEGGKFAGIKLFDNIYGLNSVIDFSVVQSEDAIGDTLVMRLSNVYQKLTTPYREGLISEDDPLYETPIGKWLTTLENRQRNLESGLTDKIINLNNIRLKPGVRLHLRMGYGSNPNSLQTVFNGVITEVQQGDVLTVIGQSDAVELTAMVNSADAKGSSGKLDGGINTGFWMSEPRDLIVRLLSMGSSYFKEWMSWGTKGVIFSESKFGIRHFGNILYEPMTTKERRGNQSVYGAVLYAETDARDGGTANSDQYASLMGDAATELSELDRVTALPSLFSGNMVKLAKLMWTNSFTNRDYELFKRNIYPGNGTGLAQYMGGDMIDAGVMMGQLTAVYDPTGTPESVEGSDVRPGGAKPDDGMFGLGSFQDMIDNAVKEYKRRNNIESNQQTIENIWATYEGNAGVSDEELAQLIGRPGQSASDLTELREEGLLESLINNVFDFALDGLSGQLALRPILGVLGDAVDDIPVVGQAVDLVSFVTDFRKPIGMMRRMVSSPVGKALGFWSATDDDDVQGYDEVSFRAQTYMKTVWDLFKTCAALLPNYIVAVRPFEDRSTVFYGKPHWLYTSGVIPVSSGLPRSATTRPRIEQAQSILKEVLDLANKENDLEKLVQLAEDSNALKDVMHFQSESVDPYEMGNTDYVNTDVDAVVDAFLADPDLDEEDVEPATRALAAVKDKFGSFSDGELQSVWDDTVWDSGADPDEVYDFIIESFTEKLQKLEEEHAKTAEEAHSEPGYLLKQWIGSDDESANRDEHDAQWTAFYGSADDPTDTTGGGTRIRELAEKDPITFAFQFGWKFSFVPVWIDPNSGFGVDSVGNLARGKYDEKFSATVDATGDRSLGDATDIWQDIRTDNFRKQPELIDIWNRLFPELGYLPADEVAKQLGSPGTVDGSEAFNAAVDQFLRFLWQDPYNRAWTVIVVDRKGDGLGDLAGEFIPGGDNATYWNWETVNRAFEKFITSPITIDDSGVPKNGGARSWMEANERAGKDARNIFTGMIEDGSDWVDNNIGQMMNLISDTLTGFVASIRLSLAQMGNALSQSGEMQRQSNILNAAFNDSIYYQEGTPGDLLRLVDNPFTREYGEPVIEVREPFQRIHFISSFDSILSNGLMENLNDVPTVVTAVSDGSHPVRVHFDKGIPPDRQVEKIIETGLYWDNAYGSGLFGALQPLLHPFEAARSYAKAALGSSDELSSRRIALAHLKEGLKDIYQGQILIIGNADIRPFDLLYIGDVYERMYGMVEVEQVIHHFTPETGFVTEITPNAIVTVNDPARWTMLSYVWSKMSNYNMRNDVRSALAVQVDRNLQSATKEIKQDDVYKYFGRQVNGAIQYTQGNSGIVKEMAGLYSGNGVDDLWNQVAKMDIAVGSLKAGATVGGAVAGTLIGTPGVGTAIGAVGGFVVGDLLWEGWQWVKENLLDQHGCYIQFLSKDGQPMDAGLSYYSGVSVGSNHTVELFPNILGLTSPSYNIKDPNGHYRITTNDLLGSIGWTETETTSLFRETSLYVNWINSNILKLANRGTTQTLESNAGVITAEILFPTGQQVGDQTKQGVIDGDTINVRVIENVNGGGQFSPGQVITVRFASVNSYELQYKNNPYSSYNETLSNDPNDLAVLAYNYLVNRFSGGERTVAIRFDKNNPIDNPEYGRLVGVIFHNAPIGTANTERLKVLSEIAGRNPMVPWDSFLEDGRPYTLNWEMVMTGYGNVDMRESLWDTNWRDEAVYNL